MKTLFNIILLVAVFISCEKDEDKAYLSSAPGKPAIMNPSDGTEKVLTAADSAVEVKFDWSAAEFGYPAEVLYTLQMDKAGNNFAEPVTVATVTSNNSASLITYELNSRLLGMGLNFGEASDIELRLRAVVNGINSSAFTDTLFSDAIKMTVTPFEVIVVYPKLWVPGSYQAWDPPSAHLLYDLKLNDRYQGYIWFPDANTEFKLLKVPDWIEATTVGDPVTGGTSGTLQIGAWGGNNVVVAGGPGYFRINADLSAATYSWSKTDWGLVGSATPGGWDADQDMTFDTSTETWSITLNLVAGEIKFRANDDWALNYGDDGFNGSLEENGENIPIAEAGNYTITLDLREPPYSYTVVKN